MIVLVTGYGGSGTSRVAEYLHRRGLPMALALKPPKAGTDLYQSWSCAVYQQDARDELQLDNMELATPITKRQHICNYKMLRLLNHGNHWGLKSPLLLLNLPMWIAECSTIAETCVVLTERPFDECQDSLRRHCENPILHEARDYALKINEALQYGYRLAKPDVIVKFGAPLDDALRGLL